MKRYCQDYMNRSRTKTTVCTVGKVSIGGDHPIRVQSMTTTDTMDTDKSIEQSIRMIKAGSELVRLTAPSKKEAINLKNIKEGLLLKGYETPLVADIHFTPNAAEIAAETVEKVRINPGNYADKKRFEEITYTDDSYAQELIRIEEKFTPLILKCKKNGTAMRIGTNHGSLSDRILSRYGDTPLGMVESAMEFLEICVKNDFHNIVLSMKASNTLVMVQAYRLLMATMKERNMAYPLHLGVTEAGDGVDGRIKSAVGIGALLEDGLGDTIRVSLTEAPEREIPVAQKLLEKCANEKPLALPDNISELCYNPYQYQRRDTVNVMNVGHNHPPVVFADLSDVNQIKPSHFFGFGYQYSIPLDKWNISDLAADYVYLGDKVIDFEIPGTLKSVYNYHTWKDSSHKQKSVPLISINQLAEIDKEQTAFLSINSHEELEPSIALYPNLILVLNSPFSNKTQIYRYIRLKIAKLNLKTPVILISEPSYFDDEQYQLWTSSDLGANLIDGFGDGIWLKGSASTQLKNTSSFGILQATRTRISKTEYISCPSCGRTLFDLEETTSKIRSKTSHLKGVKIGIMGCIVNGPGEMADADYGYVGTGPGKINLYKERQVVQKNIPEASAVEALIELIKKHGDWVEPR